MNKLIYKGNLNDFDIFAGLGIVKGNWNERALKYLHYLGATSSGLNTAQKQIEEANLETLRLDFVNQDYAVGSADTGAVETKDTFDNILTFSRGSTGTYFDSAGVLQTAAVDEPRFTHDADTLAAQGLLIEEQRTNLLLWSEAFDDAAYTKQGTSVTPNTDLAPDGTTTADTITGVSSTPAVYQTISVSGGETLSWSVFVKAGTAKWCAMGTFDGVSDVRQYFDLENGQLGSAQNGTFSDANILGPINGFYLCTITRAIDAGATSVRHQVTQATADLTTASGESELTLKLWGAQLEQGSFPTSYIKTEGSQVTRSADNCSRTLGDEYNASEGRVEAIAKNHTGEFILNLGTQSTLADVDTEKTYTLTYSSDPSASTLDLLSSGAGTVKSVKYYPREAV